VEAAFQPIYSELHSWLVEYCEIPEFDHLEVKLVDHMPRDIIGLCKYQGDNQVISILRVMWVTSSDNYRRALLLHELVHCQLGDMEHSPNDNSFMNSAVPYHLTSEELKTQLREHCQ
jgi:hypothetical protein